MEVKAWRIRAILKDNFGMRYKKIKRVPFTGNREQNLILRQQFALAFIKLLS